MKIYQPPTKKNTTRYGGVYADLDFECIRSINELLSPHRGAVLAQMGKNTSFEHSLPYVFLVRGDCNAPTPHPSTTAMHGWQAYQGTSFGCMLHGWYVHSQSPGCCLFVPRTLHTRLNTVPNCQYKCPNSPPAPFCCTTPCSFGGWIGATMWCTWWRTQTCPVLGMWLAALRCCHQSVSTPWIGLTGQLNASQGMINGTPSRARPCTQKHSASRIVRFHYGVCDLGCCAHMVLPATGTHSWEVVEWEEHNAKHTDLSSVARQAQQESL